MQIINFIFIYMSATKATQYHHCAECSTQWWYLDLFNIEVYSPQNISFISK